MSVPSNILFWVVVVPGTVVLGLVASWIVRKVSALVQWRVGPPLCQPLYDIMKLLGKEILVPQDAQRAVFMAAPLVGLDNWPSNRTHLRCFLPTLALVPGCRFKKITIFA